jgi:Glycosyl hydrolase family 3 N terminal domain
MDDRTFREDQLWPFAESVKAGVGSVMCAYNRVNGTYSCENRRLLNDILKEELDFQVGTKSRLSITLGLIGLCRVSCCPIGLLSSHFTRVS